MVLGSKPLCVNARQIFKSIAITALGFSALMPSSAAAQTTPSELVDLSLEDLINLDVIGDVTAAGEQKWEFGYNYKMGSFGGYRTGTEDRTFDEVLFSPGEVRTNENFRVVPTFIEQHVHSFFASYALNERTHINATVPYISQTTDHISSVPNFSEFALTSKGIGDIAIGISHHKLLSDKASVKGSLGIRIPTGSIDETGDTPRAGSGTEERLPYTMQLGSGTLDLTGSLSHSYRFDDFALTSHVNTTIRTGKNSNGYRLGNNVGAALSAQLTKFSHFQPGFRLSARHIESIVGQDEALLMGSINSPFPFPASISNSDNYGGNKVILAATLKVCSDASCRYSVNAEFGEPLYQNLNGIQPKDRHNVSFGVSAKF